MNRKEFEAWMKKRGLTKRTISSRLSDVNRIDLVYDVDYYYSYDMIEELLDLFIYTKADEKNGLEPKANICINGDYYNGMATLKHALKLYIGFLDESGAVKKAGISCSRPIFKGTLKEFTAFVGPHYRNLVQSISKSERSKHNGICEYCGRQAELQSAHKTGEERPEIIKKILDKDYHVGNGVYEIPLIEFDEKFKQAHMPIKDHFFFLCKDCHNAYDKSKTINDNDILSKRNKP